MSTYERGSPPTVIVSGRDIWIAAIEALPAIGNHFVNIRRIDPTAGRGYFSLVFLADDTLSRSTVVLKIYDSISNRDPYREECFQREASILAELKGQPNIVELVAELDTVDVPLQVTLPGSSAPVTASWLFQYYAVKRADSDIHSYLLSSKRNPLRSLYLFRDMCKAVQRLHQKQICHRDIKPDNFLISVSGEAVIGDFGAARFLNQSPLRANYQYVPGDYRYVPPELQLLLCEVDSRLFYLGDIFALGAILFELFTKQDLSSYVYTSGFTQDLSPFILMPLEQRMDAYTKFAGQIARRHPLPDITAFGTPIPPSIRDQVDSLYKTLADLDFTVRRQVKFESVFRRIQTCIVILQNEQRYQDWLARRRAIRAAAIPVRSGSE